MKDLIIVGAGPAGLSAARNAANLKLDAIVIESSVAGGLLSQNYPWKEVDSYLGMCGMKGSEVAGPMTSQVPKSVSIHENEQVLEIKKLKTGFKVKTTKASYSTKAIILAMGIMGQPRTIGVEGESLEGVHTVVKNPEDYKGKKVAVIGGGDTAVEYAITLSGAGAETTLIHRSEALRATGARTAELANTNVCIKLNCAVEKILGTDNVVALACKDNKTGKKEEIKVDRIFKCIGNTPNKEFLERIGVKMQDTHPKVKPNLETSIPGIFAAGDLTGNFMRISGAVVEGNRAALAAYSFLKSPYWGK